MTKTATASKTNRTSVRQRAIAIAAAETRKATIEWKTAGMETLKAQLEIAGHACDAAESEFDKAVRRYEDGAQTEMDRYMMARANREYAAVNAEYFHLMNRIIELQQEIAALAAK